MDASNHTYNLVDQLVSYIPHDVLLNLQTLSEQDFNNVLANVRDVFDNNEVLDENKFSCNDCGKSFKNKSHLTRHSLTHASNTDYECYVCKARFNREDNLTQHMKKKHGVIKRKISRENNCKQKKLRYDNGQEGGNISHTSHQQPSTSSILNEADISTTSAIDGHVEKRTVYPNNFTQKNDLIIFFDENQVRITDILSNSLSRKTSIKWYFNVQVKMVKDCADGSMDEAHPHFRSKTKILLQGDDNLAHDMNASFQNLHTAFEDFLKMGSGWKLEEVLQLDIYIITYKPLNGSSYIPLPSTLAQSRSLLNIRNNDQRCLFWCVLASLYPVGSDKHAYQIQHYLPYLNSLNTTDIQTPTPLSQISKFETQNDVSVNVFGFEDGEIYPLCITRKKFRHHVNLLYLTDNGKSHYVLIKDFNNFLSRTKKHKERHFFCYLCLHGFTTESKLNEHKENCQNFSFQKITLPKENDTISFKDFAKTARIPFVIYADFECLTRKIDTCHPNPKMSSTTPYQSFEPYSFGYQRVCIDQRYNKAPVIYRGENVVECFLESMFNEEKEIREILSNIAPLELTEDDKLRYKNAKHCYVCKGGFTPRNRKVVDHDHLTGEIRGVACNNCNLQIKTPSFIPIIFHNLTGFDGNIIMSKLGKFKDKNISVIPNNMEKYLSFSIGNLRFLDSLQFLDSSLETLASNLAKEGETHFKYLKKGFPDSETSSLLLRKGVFPYDFVDDISKLEVKHLPAKENFYNKLTDQNISEEDYTYAQTVWEQLNVTTLGEYSDIYLKTDVVILADVFERFRDICLEDYELDPCHYYTTPGFSWSAMLKKTGIVLDCITDIDQLLFLEKGIRGGVSGIFNRYKEANNPYLKETFNPNKTKSYLGYFDANNLYGYSMSQPLPHGFFKWVEKEEIEKINFLKIPENSTTGYILEVDLEYPEELHDKHSDFPLAPEKMTISVDDLSPYSKRILKDLQNNDPKQKQHRRESEKLIFPKVEKLVPNLYDKEKYVVHYKNLQLYMSLGMKLKKIHRVLEFQQSCWLKPYINFNTEKRKNAKNDFEKCLYKLFNNAIFGRTLMNVRKHVDVKLCNTKEKLFKYTCKPSFEYCRIFNEDLVGVKNKRVNVLMNQPVYVGFSILDLSKHHMYEFYYLHMKKKYGEKLTLCFSDTDSFLFHIETEDMYRDMKIDDHLFDTSDYPKNHFLYSEKNKKVIGKFKDETSSVPISNFVGLRSKVYSFQCGESEKHTVKGISKTASSKLKHSTYKDCLFNETVHMCSMNIIRSQNHNLYAKSIRKKGLVPFDDKRFILNDGIHTRPYGHKDNK